MDYNGEKLGNHLDLGSVVGMLEDVICIEENRSKTKQIQNVKQMNKTITDVQRRAMATARAAGRTINEAARSGGKIALAALRGNPAEEVLSLAAHDPLRNLERVREALDAGVPSQVEFSHSRDGSIPDAELAKLFRAIGTAVWKLAGRMLNEETKEPKDEYRRLWRHVEAIRDALTTIGVDVIDWTGKRYNEGMSLKVVSEEERPGTKEPEIIETLLPTIRFRKQVQLQQGEVVVSRPAAAITKDARSVGANDE